MVERKVERKKGGKESREEGLVAAAVLVKGLLLTQLSFAVPVLDALQSKTQENPMSTAGVMPKKVDALGRPAKPFSEKNLRAL
jgi:hypothetical protein